MKVNTLAEKFLAHSARSCTPGSLQGARDRLRLFLAEFGSTNTKKVRRERLIQFLHESQGNLSDSTHRQNITFVERLQTYGVRFEYLRKPWLKPGDVKKPRMVNRDTLPTLEQMVQILSIMRKDAQPIIRSLRLTGARPGELCAARIDQLEGTPGEMVIVQTEHKTARKTGMKRRILLSPQAEEIVREEIGDRAAGPIFLTARGLPWLRDRLSREFRRCRDHFGISKKIVLYSLRHELASLMIDAGADISEVKVQLGHTDIGTTQKYVHPDEKKVRRSVMQVRDVKAAG
jgi:integrase